MQVSSSAPLIATDSLPPWVLEAAFWCLAGGFLAALATACGVWILVVRARNPRERVALGLLEEIDRKLERGLAARDDEDLRRVERVLIEIREGLARLEERSFTRRRPPRPTSTGRDLLVPVPRREAGERATERLFALGYDRVELLTPPDELEREANGDFEIGVEARRDGVLHKGRVVFRDGRIEAVDLRPTYSAFP